MAYARVSGHGQKDDLERQKQMPELYCAHQGWKFEVMADPDYCQANWRKVYLR